MRSLLILLLLLLLAVGIGWGIKQDPGIVLISFNQWQIETSVWFALLIIIVLFIVMYILIRLVIGVSHWPERWSIRRRSAKLKRGQYYAELAICVFIEEKWEMAEKYFVKAALHLDKSLLYYIGAALAAHQQKSSERRDAYIRKAYMAEHNAEISLGILQAKLEIKAAEWAKAEDTLNKLKTLAPNHPLLAKLQSQLP